MPVFLEDDFCPAVVFLNLSVDLDHAARQLPDVADTLQVTGKDNDGERAQAEVVAEVKEVNSAGTLFNPHDLAPRYT